MALSDRVRAIAQRIFGPPQVRSPRVPPREQSGYAGASGGAKWGFVGQRRNSAALRRFSERDVWVRTAINRRKREISRAEWTLYRTDDPHANPDPGIQTFVTELLARVNDKGDSLSTMLCEIVEDLLVLDAGCIEKEKTFGGKIVALWPVMGEEIAPDPAWDGSQPKKPRYFQVRDGHVVAEYLNTDLVYMMSNPRTCSAVGYSPLEVLFETVEADLYGQDFEYGTLRETAPSGLLYLGGGVPPDKVQAFRDQWESDIAGRREIAILGGGGFDPETGSLSSPPSFTPFGRSARDEQRREYMKWLATKVAAAFEMDLLAFNLSEAIHKSVGSNLQQKTDEGLLGLAGTIEQYITREIIWEIDPLHRHGFQFVDLTRRDALAKAQERKLYMDMGVTYPNEIRSEDGKLPVPWGEFPFPGTVQAKTEDPAASIEEIEDGEQEDDPKSDDPNADDAA